MQAGPLFKQRIVDDYMSKAKWPADLKQKHEIVLRWIETLTSGTLAKTKESSLHGDFFKDIFEEVLGYTGIVKGKGERWTLHAEKTTSTGGGSADGAIGFFQKDGKDRVVAPIELKGANVELDRVQTRGYTPVQQGWRYANETPNCNWVIVSNFQELRLYHTHRTPAYYELFRLVDLADIDIFKRFYFLLCCENFLSEYGPSTTERLLWETGEAEEKITKDLYNEYKEIRFELLRRLKTLNPDRSQEELVGHVQKLLDRILFICFCEDRGLLPPNIVNETYNRIVPGLTKWMSFKLLFRAIDHGDPPAHIPGYNGGLFAEDPRFDSLVVDDDTCDLFQRLHKYDYESEVSVNILGHIFEQSITDIEMLKGGNASVSSRRKKEGVFYTPSYVTEFIVEKTIGTLLKERFEAILERHNRPDRIPDAHRRKKTRAMLAVWEEYRNELMKIRVLDPACGSGAFLVTAFDYLLAEYQRVNEIIADLSDGQYSVFDLNKTILNENLFGVDINPESVEITKLSLWLKTAERGRKLTYLDDNIKCGNSIVSDPKIDAKAFNWEKEFASVFADGGFHVVIGNPPYVSIESIQESQKEYFRQHWQTFSRRYDLYGIFMELSISKLCRPDGKIGMIIPSSILNNQSFAQLREYILNHRHIDIIAEMGPGVFKDANNETVIIILSQRDTQRSKESWVSTWRTHPVPDNLASHAFEALDTSVFRKSKTYDFSINLTSRVNSIIEKMQEHPFRLGDLVEGSQGLITGNNEAFIVSEAEKLSEGLEDAICKPMAVASGFSCFTPIEIEGYILYVTEDPEGKYPNVFRRLSRFRDALANRGEVKAGAFPWWRVHRPRDKRFFDTTPKIVVQDIRNLKLKDRVVATLDDRGVYIDHTANVLIAKDDAGRPVDLYALLGILNSWLTDFYFSLMHVDIHTKLIYLRSFPIPDMDSSSLQELSQLVRNLLDLHKEVQANIDQVVRRIEEDLLPSHSHADAKLKSWFTLDFTKIRNHLKKKFRVDIPVRERDQWSEYFAYNRKIVREKKQTINDLLDELDQTVYALYGLSEEEIKAVESEKSSREL